MTTARQWILIGSCSIGFLFGCGTEPIGLDDLSRYIRDPENGLVRSRTVMGLTATVQLLPPQVTALREMDSSPLDSCSGGWAALMDANDDMLCFTLNLKTDGEKRKGDVMYSGATSVEDFKAQAFDLNFGWEQQLELRCGERTYVPVLSSLENTYSLSSDRNVMIVFVPESKNDPDFYGSKDIELVWHDAVFNTGIQRFRFSRNELKAVPQPTVRS